MTGSGLKAVVFDVNETLIDMAPLAERMQAKGLSKEAFQAWFSAVLRDGTTLAVTDTFAPFREVGTYHIQAMLKAANIPDAASGAEEILGGLEEVMPHPDVESGFRTLKGKGLKIATMTNGSASTSKSSLQRAGLDSYVDEAMHMDISMVQRWKPHASVYEYAAEKLGLHPNQVMLIAVHPWDCHGAKAAGLRSLYLNRHDVEFAAYFKHPDYTVTSLTELEALEM